MSVDPRAICAKHSARFSKARERQLRTTAARGTFDCALAKLIGRGHCSGRGKTSLCMANTASASLHKALVAGQRHHPDASLAANAGESASPQQRGEQERPSQCRER
eukprot:scaffold1144_cov215-Pinguiococcus_pyrenoidosus.AAC.2